jgi:hypothetical protein
LLGDVGATEISVGTLQGVLASHEARPFAAAVLVGDLSYANGFGPLWDEFGTLTQFVAARLPIMSTPGNHEWFDSFLPDSPYAYDLLAYASRYGRAQPFASAPSEPSGLFYSFSAGLTHWVMLAGYCPNMTSTRTQACLAPGSAQRSWLERDLAAVDRAITPWVVVVFHQPFVNSNTAHAIAVEGVPMQLAVEALLYSAKVDIVISGHVHAYERSCKTYNYSCVADGPLYLTVGDGGTPEGLAATWVEPCPAWSAYRQGSWGHGELEPLNATHLSWRWRQNDDLTPSHVDELVLVKGQQVADAGKCVTVTPELSARGRRRLARLQVAAGGGIE